MKVLSLFTIVSLSCSLITVSTQLTAQQRTDHASEASKKVVPDYTVISKLTCGQTTNQDVLALLGKPVGISAGREMIEWAYHFDKLDIQVQFNAENKLINYLYHLRNPDKRSDLDIQTIKSIRVGATKADVVSILGEPTFLSISPNRIDMTYSTTADRSQLQIVLKRKTDFLVTDFQFSKTAKRPLSIDLDKLVTIKNGKTTLNDVATLFGEPTQKMISQDAENWYYESIDSKLTLKFNRDQAETVVAYEYNRKQN